MSTDSNQGQLDWGRLFGPGSHRFQMGLRPGNVGSFFAAKQAGLLAERRHWLQSDRPRYCQIEAEGEPLLDELETMAQEWALASAGRGLSALDRLADLGARLEPDFLLLSRADPGPVRLAGGVVCFPSSWSLEEKMGRPVGEIHGVVPGLNAQLGAQVDRFLERLAPGTAWERENWGLSPDSELNRHPARRLPCLGSGTTLQTTWLRVEHQLLHRMRQTRGVLFGIRLSVHRLDQLARDAAVADGLARALETMAPEVATYKGLSQCREQLAQLLRA